MTNRISYVIINSYVIIIKINMNNILYFLTNLTLVILKYSIKKIKT